MNYVLVIVSILIQQDYNIKSTGFTINGLQLLILLMFQIKTLSGNLDGSIKGTILLLQKTGNQESMCCFR